MLDAVAAIARALLYAGLLSAAGAAFAEATLRVSPETARFLLPVVRRGAVITIMASLAGALILIFRLGGEFDEALLSAVLSSSVGAGTGLQLAGAVLLLASLDDDSARFTRVSNAAIALSSFAFSGHAAALGIVDGIVAAVHVAAAAWWVGSLWLLEHACRRWELETVADLVRRFTAIAVRVIGALVIAGLLVIAVLVDFTRDPWLTPYGQMLTLKVAIALTVLGLAAYNKYRLTPRLLASDRSAMPALHAMVRTELVGIGAVLLTTAVLTTYSSPHE